MNRFSRVFSLGILILVLMFAAGVQGIFAAGSAETPAGTAGTRELPNTGFDDLLISGIGSVVLTGGDTWAVSLSGDTAMLDAAEVSQQGEHLTVALENSHRWPGEGLSLEITLPVLTGLELKNRTGAVLAGITAADDLKVSVLSGSTLAAEGLKAENARITLSSSSGLTGEITAGALTLDVHGSSVQGDMNADNLVIQAVNSGIDSRGVIKNARVTLRGDSEVLLDLAGAFGGGFSSHSDLYLYDDSTLSVTSDGALSAVVRDDAVLKYRGSLDLVDSDSGTTVTRLP